MREHAIGKGAREHTLGINFKEEGWEKPLEKVISEERLEMVMELSRCILGKDVSSL